MLKKSACGSVEVVACVDSLRMVVTGTVVHGAWSIVELAFCTDAENG